MATKSVIEIDVLDEKFQTFAKEFEKIKKSLANFPSDWNKSNIAGVKSTQAIGKGLDDAKKKQDNFNKSIKDGGEALKKVASITANIARDMANAAFSIGKFFAFGSLTAGFGLGALASSVSDKRRTAQGLGITTGELRSAETYGSRYIDPLQVLGKLADIKSDVRQQYKLGVLGVNNIQGKNPAELLPETLTKARDLFKQFGGQKSPLESLGVTDIIDYESLRRLAGLSKEEFQDFIDNLKKGNQQFKTFDKLDKAWQDFWVKLNETSQKLQITLIDILAKLPEPLSKLSEAVAEAIKTFLSHPELQKWLDDLVIGIKNFATYLVSGGLKKDIDKFWTTLEEVRITLEQFARKTDKIILELETFVTRLKNLFFGSKNPEIETETGKNQQKNQSDIDSYLDKQLRKFWKWNLGLSEKEDKSPSTEINKIPNEVKALQPKGFYESLDKAKKDYKDLTGKDLPVTSTLRTRKEQQDLYNRWKAGEKGIFMPLNPADYPNKEFFHQGNVDIGINQVPKGFDINEFMSKEGFKGGNPKDPVHFNYVDPLKNLEKKISNNVNLNINNETGGSAIVSANALQTFRGAA